MLLFYIVVIGALVVTGLFLWGAWKVIRSSSLRERVKALLRALGLTRADMNPIIEASEQAWERGGVMNPAVIKAGDKTHVFYRAVGADGVSRIGYASSKDGVRIDERLPYPVFALAANSGGPGAYTSHPSLSGSGGTHAFAGVEDPRAVVIDDRMYLTYNAFSDWGSLRVGVSSLSLEDLLNKRWQWSKPVYLSPKNQVHKSWVLFPEKIAGKFSVLHSLHSGARDKVLIEHLDELKDDPGIESPYLHGENTAVWDSRLRGAGPPPIKTKKGWLLLYHANDAREPHRYKLGAMLLDLVNPSHVIARSPAPVLEPDAWYENHAKPGIVYACGATTEGDTLRVYYGGSDSVVCAATTSLSKLLDKLVPPNAPALAPAYAYA